VLVLPPSSEFFLVTIDLSIVLAASGGLLVGVLFGYLMRSYISYRRRRRRRTPLGYHALTPPGKARSGASNTDDLAAASLAPIDNGAGVAPSRDTARLSSE